MAEEKADDAIVSMEDVLQEHEALEDEANAVLGASDDKECTYAQVEQSLHKYDRLDPQSQLRIAISLSTLLLGARFVDSQ